MPRKKENKNNGLPEITIKGKKKPTKKNVGRVKTAKKVVKKGKTNLTNLTSLGGKKPVDKLGRDKSKVEERIAKKKALVLEGLKDSFGIVTNAIAKADVSNVTFYTWYRDDKEFAKGVDDIQGQIEIIVDDRIKQGILNNDGAMIRFYASACMKKYRNKVGIGQGEDLEPFEFIIKTKKITDNDNGED